MCTVSKRSSQVGYRLERPHKEFQLQFQNYAPPSLRVIRVAKGQRANVTYVRTITEKPFTSKLGKWFPLHCERAHSLNFCLFECMLIERKRRERLNNNYRAINFPRLYNSSQTTSPQPNTNFYHTQSIIMSTLYLYTYIIYYELFYSQRLLLK